MTMTETTTVTLDLATYKALVRATVLHHHTLRAAWHEDDIDEIHELESLLQSLPHPGLVVAEWNRTR